MESKRSYGIFCNEAMSGENYVFCTVEVRGGKDITKTTSQLEKKKNCKRTRKKRVGKHDVVEENDKLRKSTPARCLCSISCWIWIMISAVLTASGSRARICTTLGVLTSSTAA